MPVFAVLTSGERFPLRVGEDDAIRLVAAGRNDMENLPLELPGVPGRVWADQVVRVYRDE